MDKEIALILAEMLIKQDDTTEQVKVIVAQVNGLATEVKGLTTEVKGLTEQAVETNSILRDFMGTSV